MRKRHHSAAEWGRADNSLPLIHPRIFRSTFRFNNSPGSQGFLGALFVSRKCKKNCGSVVLKNWERGFGESMACIFPHQPHDGLSSPKHFWGSAPLHNSPQYSFFKHQAKSSNLQAPSDTEEKQLLPKTLAK